MHFLLKEIRHNPILWRLGFVPIVFAVAAQTPQAHRLLFVLKRQARKPQQGSTVITASNLYKAPRILASEGRGR